jgi:hypothetical protein
VIIGGAAGGLAMVMAMLIKKSLEAAGEGCLRQRRFPRD